MVTNLVFRWPKPLFFMVLGAHGIYMYLRYHPHRNVVIQSYPAVIRTIIMSSSLFTSMSSFHVMKEVIMAGQPTPP